MLEYLKIVVVGIALGVAAALIPIASARAPVNSTDATVLVKLESGHGSGVHIGGGYIVTAAHVAEGEAKFSVRYPSNATTDQVEVVAIDKQHDLALLKTPYNGPAAKLSCKALSVGDAITIVGNPFDMEFVTTYGRVAAGTQKVGRWAEAFIGDIVAGPGNSGGPVFDESNRVVGILVGGLGAGSIPIVGWSYIVPSTTICRLMGRS